MIKIFILNLITIQILILLNRHQAVKISDNQNFFKENKNKNKVNLRSMKTYIIPKFADFERDTEGSEKDYFIQSIKDDKQFNMESLYDANTPMECPGQKPNDIPKRYCSAEGIETVNYDCHKYKLITKYSTYKSGLSTLNQKRYIKQNRELITCESKKYTYSYSFFDANGKFLKSGSTITIDSTKDPYRLLCQPAVKESVLSESYYESKQLTESLFSSLTRYFYRGECKYFTFDSFYREKYSINSVFLTEHPIYKSIDPAVVIDSNEFECIRMRSDPASIDTSSTVDFNMIIYQMLISINEINPEGNRVIYDNTGLKCKNDKPVEST